MEEKKKKNEMMQELLLELVSDIEDKGTPGAKAMRCSMQNRIMEEKIIVKMNLGSDLGKIADSFFEQINTLYKEFIKEYIDE